MTFGEVCAGAGGMSRGLMNAGFECSWLVENDKAAAGVLHFHHPKSKLYADLTKFYPEAGRHTVDLLAGVTPCQDLSVAGLRAGMAGKRSGLFFQMVRVCRKLKPRFVVWENVCGALSSREGRDFAAVIGAFTGCTPEVPQDGWGGSAGFAPAITKGRWNVAWRVLDTQFFGCAQRRERVFIVASLGDASCIEILLEPEGVQGNLAPSREAGKETTGTLSARTKGGGGLGTDFDLDGGVVEWPVDVAPTLNAHFGEKQGLEGQHINGGVDYLFQPSISMCLNAGAMGRFDATTETLIPTRQGGFFDDSPKPTLTSNGDAHSGFRDEKGIVAIRLAQTSSNGCGIDESGAAYTLDGANGQAVSSKMGVRRLIPVECERLQSWPDNSTLKKSVLKLDGNEWHATCKVFRQADGPRYKQLGNGVTSVVAEWLGLRIKRFAL